MLSPESPGGGNIMSVSKYNSEGYYDPTTHAALTNIENEEKRARFRPIVYICSPFSGDVEGNTANARRYCRFAVESGCIPIAPHLLFPQFMNDADETERDLALFMDIVLLTKCAELWAFGGSISPGMAREIRKAETRSMPIRHFTTDCEEVTQ